MNVAQLVGLIENEVLRTKVQFENVDYLEDMRSLILIWTEEDCRKCKIRRVLHWGRGRRGTRFGIRGVGPYGEESGDQEHWVFPCITKSELIAIVSKIAATTMFNVQETLLLFGGETSVWKRVSVVPSIVMQMRGRFCKNWEKKDRLLSRIERTKTIAGSML